MKYYLIFLLSVISIFSFGQKARDMKFEEVREDGLKSYMDIKEPVKSLRMESGLLMEIEPIDASTLNDMFYENSMYSGKYNYTFYTTKVEDHFLDLKKRKRRYLKSEDEFLYEGLYYLLDNDDINEATYEQLVYEVSLGTKEAEEQEEEDIFTSHNKQNFNPFYTISGDMYMNVFKIKIKNPSSSPVNNDLRITVFNGGDNLESLTDDQIKSYYSYEEVIKLQNLLRANIRSQDVFPGSSTIQGYFATLPLNLSDSEISISVSDETSTTSISWNADIKKDPISNIKKFYEVRIKPSSSTFRSYYVISSEDAETNIFIVGNYLYVDEADIDKKVEIHYYGMKPLKLFHGKTDSIKISDYLDFQKMKRNKIKLSANNLSEVKRSGKAED